VGVSYRREKLVIEKRKAEPWRRSRERLRLEKAAHEGELKQICRRNLPYEERLLLMLVLAQGLAGMQKADSMQAETRGRCEECTLNLPRYIGE